MPTFVEVYREHSRFVWNSLRRLGLSEHEAEDAMQEIFVIVNGKLATFEGRSKLSTWIYGITFRVVSDRRRRSIVRHEKLANDEAIFEREGLTNIFEEVSVRQGHTILERILDKMTLEQRATFVLFELEGYESSEIAESMGCPLGTVHSRLHSAREVFTRESDRWRRNHLEPRVLAPLKQRQA